MNQQLSNQEQQGQRQHDQKQQQEEDKEGEQGYHHHRRHPRRTGGVSHPFPQKLHSLLESRVHEDIISWQLDGMAFTIHKPQDFLADVLTKVFNQTKLKSFQRQLSFYNFKRITSGPDAGAYRHPLFIRGMPHLSRNIIRGYPFTRAPVTSISIASSTSKYSSGRHLGVPRTPPPTSIMQEERQYPLQHSNGSYFLRSTPAAPINNEFITTTNNNIRTKDAITSTTFTTKKRVDEAIREAVENVNEAIRKSLENFHSSLKTIANESFAASHSSFSKNTSSVAAGTATDYMMDVETGSANSTTMMISTTTTSSSSSSKNETKSSSKNSSDSTRYVSRSEHQHPRYAMTSYRHRQEQDYGLVFRSDEENINPSTDNNHNKSSFADHGLSNRNNNNDHKCTGNPSGYSSLDLYKFRKTDGGESIKSNQSFISERNNSLPEPAVAGCMANSMDGGETSSKLSEGGTSAFNHLLDICSSEVSYNSTKIKAGAWNNAFAYEFPLPEWARYYALRQDVPSIQTRTSPLKLSEASTPRANSSSDEYHYNRSHDHVVEDLFHQP